MLKLRYKTNFLYTLTRMVRCQVMRRLNSNLPRLKQLRDCVTLCYYIIIYNITICCINIIYNITTKGIIFSNCILSMQVKPEKTHKKLDTFYNSGFPNTYFNEQVTSFSFWELTCRTAFRLSGGLCLGLRSGVWL